MTDPRLPIAGPVRRLPSGAGLPLPDYATPHAAGLDLLAAVDADVVLRPLARALIPTGIGIALPDGFQAEVRPRSGLALKHGITVLNGPGTIDADYRGEIGVLLINLGAEPFTVGRGLRIAQLAFWDDVVVLSRYRESFVHRVFQSERGIGAPVNPVRRRDKNVRGWHVTFARHGLYLLDAIHLRRVIGRARAGGADVVLFDRYLHDELANLPLENPVTRAFARFAAALAPRPDVAYLLDADPVAARERKPEYPLDFLVDSRRRYHALAPMVGMTLIPPLPLEDAKAVVVSRFVERWNASRLQLGDDAFTAA